MNIQVCPNLNRFLDSPFFPGDTLNNLVARAQQILNKTADLKYFRFVLDLAGTPKTIRVNVSQSTDNFILSLPYAI